jgi:hypothetical protein
MVYLTVLLVFAPSPCLNCARSRSLYQKMVNINHIRIAIERVYCVGGYEPSDASFRRSSGDSGSFRRRDQCLRKGNTKRLREVRKNQKNVEPEIFGERVVPEKGKTEVLEKRVRQERPRLLHILCTVKDCTARANRKRRIAKTSELPHTTNATVALSSEAVRSPDISDCSSSLSLSISQGPSRFPSRIC